MTRLATETPRKSLTPTHRKRPDVAPNLLHLLRGDTLDAVGDRYDGDVLGSDPVQTWDKAATGAERCTSHSRSRQVAG